MGASVYGVRSFTSNSGLSFTFDIPKNAENDIALVLVSVRNTGSTLSISGYTGIDAQRNNDSWTSRWFIKRMAAGGDTSITVASSSSGATDVTVYIIKGAKTSGTAASIVDGSNYVSGSVGATCASPALTTTTDNCLLLQGVTWDGAFALCDPSDINVLSAVSNSGGQTCGISFKGTAGAISTFTWKGSNASNSGLSWVVAIKSESANQSIRATDGRAYLIKLGGFDTVTTSAPDSVTGLTTISSVIMNTVANTTAGSTTVSTGQPTSAPWPIDGLKLTCSEAVTATAWVGKFVAIPSANVTGKVLQIPYGFGGTVDSSRVGPNGLIAILADASNNYLAYNVSQQVDWSIQGSGAITLIPGTSTTIGSSGDPSAAVTKVGLFFQRATTSASAVDIYMGSPFVQNSVTAIIGGDSTYKISALNVALLQFGGSQQNRVLPYPVYPGSVSFQGSAQLVSKFGLQFGDGTNETHVDFSGQSFEFPYADRQWRVEGNSGGVTIYASANDVMNFSACLLVSSTAEDFVIHASSTANDIYDFNGLSLVGWNVTDNKGLTWEGTTFKSGGTVTIAGGGDLTNCTIASTTSTNAVLSITANGSIVTTSTIDCVMDTGANADYHISLGASVTAITLNGVTLTGTPGTDKFYSALASGTLTITTDGTGTALVAGDVTFIGGSTATAVISAPQVYQEVVVSGFTAGSRIQIYDTTSATELFNGTASAGDTVISGSTATWTDPTAAAADRAIRVRVAYVNGTSAEQWQQFTGLTCGQTGATAEITYPVTPIDDDTYNANAIDGPAIYATSGITFTDAATDLVNISIAGGAVTWQTIYACFVYWLFTAAGIDDDVAYIDAPDPANYLLTSMKLKNTHANPLTVTGGYGRSATTGLVADIIDTAGSTGNIFPSPDHVVAYATGSGALTAGDITNIWAAATRTLSATQDANIVQVAGITVDGTGTDGDPWGPA